METKTIKVHETYVIRGEKISVDADQLIDVATHEAVFDEELDDQAVQKAFDQYRLRHQIMPVKEIVALRHQLGLTQRGFAALLGWSPTTVATYETGALPSKAKHELLQLLRSDLQVAKSLYEKNKRKMSPNDRKAFEANCYSETEAQQFEQAQNQIGEDITNLFAVTNYSEYSGFTTFSLKKFLNAALFFINQVPQLTKTKLNKLMFYMDFKYFQTHTVSITGVPYARINYGPVPDQYSLLYGLMAAQELVSIEEAGVDQYSWDYFNAQQPADEAVFNRDELAVLRQVVARFKDETARNISEISHQEDAWKDTPNSAQISYEHAMTLHAL
jgi:putative zinc finger/helix-turn-helix YgiT family protein